MNNMSPIIESKLPKVGTTIFTVMSALAQKFQAVNLGQGFPDFDCDPLLIDAVSDAMRRGLNQYPSMLGVPELRRAIADKIQRLHGQSYDPETEITVCAGATQAIINAVLAVVRPGDEVIVLEPCYDSYIPNIELTGASVVRVPLSRGSFRPDLDRIAAAITSRTRMLIINTPHNPSATVWTRQELLGLQELLEPTPVIVLSDEVYEHMVYAPMQHHSVSEFPKLAQRSFIVSSFGKTLHVTGWKVGYCVAPASFTKEYRKVHQYNVFTVNTPMQHGIASYMANLEPMLQLPAFYQRKRDLFRAGLLQTRFRLLPCEGSYFQCARIDELSGAEKNLGEADFCQWLTQEIGVCAIPLSAFYADGDDQRTVRFCFAKKDETLNSALQRLARL